MSRPQERQAVACLATIARQNGQRLVSRKRMATSSATMTSAARTTNKTGSTRGTYLPFAYPDSPAASRASALSRKIRPADQSALEPEDRPAVSLCLDAAAPAAYGEESPGNNQFLSGVDDLLNLHVEAFPGFNDRPYEPLSDLLTPSIDPPRLRPEHGVLPFNVRADRRNECFCVLPGECIDLLRDDLHGSPATSPTPIARRLRGPLPR